MNFGVLKALSFSSGSHLIGMWPRANSLTSVILRVFICRMEKQCLTPKLVGGINWVKIHRMPSTSAYLPTT